MVAKDGRAINGHFGPSGPKARRTLALTAVCSYCGSTCAKIWSAPHAREASPIRNQRAREVWLACFERVLEGSEVKYQFPPQHLQGFREFLKSFSAWMVNQA
jgi:hypothetical protein